MGGCSDSLSPFCGTGTSSPAPRGQTLWPGPPASSCLQVGGGRLVVAGVARAWSAPAVWFRVCSVSICVSVSLSGLMGIGSFLLLGPRGRSQVTLSACEDFLRKAVQKVLGVGGLFAFQSHQEVSPLLSGTSGPFCPFLLISLVFWDTL